MSTEGTGPHVGPQIGETAPPIVLDDQHGETVDVASFAGRHVFVYFYPKASTPGCTTQACNLRDLRAESPGALGDTVVIGISPDLPGKLANFDSKHELGFTLLSDPDHAVVGSYGAWGLKKLYGKEYEGVIRSAVMIAPDGTVSRRWPKLSPKQTPAALLDALSDAAAHPADTVGDAASPATDPMAGAATGAVTGAGAED